MEEGEEDVVFVLARESLVPRSRSTAPNLMVADLIVEEDP